MSELQRVVLAAGGTAGHVFPALAIRAGLVERGVDVRLFCDERALGYLGELDRSAIEVVPSGGLVTGSVRTRLGNLAKLARGLMTMPLDLAPSLSQRRLSPQIQRQ